MSERPNERMPGDQPTGDQDLAPSERDVDQVDTGDEDPDVAAARERSPEREEDTLTTDDLRPEEEMTEYQPPEEPSAPTATGETSLDEAQGETIDDRLAQEEPDTGP